MTPIRLDRWACVSDAPTSVPFELSPSGSVFRGMRDLEDARAYADTVCKFFAEHGVSAPVKGGPASVYVVRGPTSTTSAPFEVVAATCGYSILYKTTGVSSISKAPTPISTQAQMDEQLLLQKQMSTTLSNSILISQSSVITTEILEMLRNEVAACLSLIAAGAVPPKKDDNEAESNGVPAIRTFMESTKWGQSIEVRGLFAAYVKAGFIDVDEPMSIPDFTPSPYKRGSLPLEAAIITGNHSAFDALLENGADFSKVPSPSTSKFSGSGKPMINIFSFIELYSPNEQDGVIFMSKIKECIMLRQIRAADHDTNTSLTQKGIAGARHRIGNV